jgi:DNA modification methylase
MKDINIKYYPADDLVMAEYNPRQLTKDQYTQLKDSIMRFGLVDPLIVNKNKERKNILVGGHQRLRIAKEMGVESIPCVEVDLTLDQEKELNIRLNKNVGEWDFDALANYFDVGELTEWGFSNDDLQFYEDEPKQGLIDDDEIPEVEEPITQAGDLWILGEHRLLCGDATKKEDVDLLMNGKKADMVFTDPPYGIDYQDLKKNHKKIENDIDPTNVLQVLNYYKKIPMFVCCNWKSISIFLDVLKEIDFKSCIVWDKQTRIQNLDKFAKQHEFILYAGEFGGEKTVDVDVWQVKREVRKDHPTAKPIELIIRAINTFDSIKIYDPFLGSGSTLIACEKTNRKCYGMEIDPHYCDVIVKRWEEFSGKKAERVERAEG